MKYRLARIVSVVGDYRNYGYDAPPANHRHLIAASFRDERAVVEDEIITRSAIRTVIDSLAVTSWVVAKT